MMSDLLSRFEIAAEEQKNLKRPPDRDSLLQFYALYRQATIGDVQGERPGVFHMPAKAKYDAWANLKGMTKEVAMQGYIDLVAKFS